MSYYETELGKAAKSNPLFALQSVRNNSAGWFCESFIGKLMFEMYLQKISFKVRLRVKFALAEISLIP